MGLHAPAALVAEGEVRLSEVIGAMSYALDIVEGQPMGHAARSCAIGMRVAEAIDLPAELRGALYYALLIKDAGCSANASKTAELFGTDDRAFKRGVKLVDGDRRGQMERYVLGHVEPGGSPLKRARKMASVLRHAPGEQETIYELRCERGAEVASMLELEAEAAHAIRALDEHWDGGGHPEGLAGEAIPLLGRILGLAQTVEVFAAAQDGPFACAMARSRSGTWFDPALVRALSSFEEDDAFWNEVMLGDDPAALVARLEPVDIPLVADEARLDRIAEAFASVIDAKSPYTSRHSAGVAEIAVGIASQLGHGARALRDLHRAGLLHDVGKLGVSNRILDKPGKLDAAEWAAMREHPRHTLQILSRVPAFRPLAKVAAAHHEKLDGSGYHLGLTAEDLPQAARILTVADICEALSAERPYRDAMPMERVLSIMAEDVPHKLDAEVFAALRAHLGA